MSQAGARGPAPPPKPPPPVPAKPASPAAPPVAPKGVAPPKAPAAPSPTRVGKTTMLGVQAPKAATAPVTPPADDSWDVAPTRVEDKAEQVPLPMASPSPPVVAPVAAHPAPPVPSGLTASDVRLIVRMIVDDALLPLQRALVEAQQRIADLERRPAAAPTVVLSPTPGPAPVAPSAYTSAMTAPAYSVVPHYSVPPAPLLDVEAIERDVPLDVNNPFDGARRRRRMAVFVVVALVALFGGLFGLLAESYTPHP